MKRSELIKQLQSAGQPDDYIIAEIWTIEDLCEALEKNNVVIEGMDDNIDADETPYKIISKAEANECLEYISHAHDASIGINWDVIEVLVECWLDAEHRSGR